LELIVQSAALKKALSIVALATGEKEDTVASHALFRLKDGKLKMLATDGDRFAVSGCETLMADESETNEFTADPKKLTALLNSSDSESVRLLYKMAETTLHVFASEHKDSYVAFGSFKPGTALPFEDELSNLQKVRAVNAEILKRGIKFSRGFMSPEENNRKYSCVYIAKGVFYGSNGYNAVGAFQSPEFEGIDFLILRGPMIPQVVSAIDRFDADKVVISSTSKFVSFWSNDENGFGYLKSNEELPKLPISLERPDWDYFTVDRGLLSKKLGRLAISSVDSKGVHAVISTDSMDLTTLDERASTENIPIKRKVGGEVITSTPDFKGLREALNQYWTDDVDIFVKSRCSIYCDGQVEIQKNEKEPPEVIQFKAVSVIALTKTA